MHKITRHFSHYFPLIGIFAAGFIGIYIFSFDRDFQILLATAVAVAYVVWGVVHHYLHKDLYPEIVMEYLAIATLGLVIVLSLIING